MSQKAFIKYSRSGRLIPGILILVPDQPPGDGWMQVPTSLCCDTVPFPASDGSTHKKKGYMRYDGEGNVIAGSTIVSQYTPKDGHWIQIPFKRCC